MELTELCCEVFRSITIVNLNPLLSSWRDIDVNEEQGCNHIRLPVGWRFLLFLWTWLLKLLHLLYLLFHGIRKRNNHILSLPVRRWLVSELCTTLFLFIFFAWTSALQILNPYVRRNIDGGLLAFCRLIKCIERIVLIFFWFLMVLIVDFWINWLFVRPLQIHNMLL